MFVERGDRFESHDAAVLYVIITAEAELKHAASGRIARIKDPSGLGSPPRQYDRGPKRHQHVARIEAFND